MHRKPPSKNADSDLTCTWEQRHHFGAHGVVRNDLVPWASPLRTLQDVHSISCQAFQAVLKTCICCTLCRRRNALAQVTKVISHKDSSLKTLESAGDLCSRITMQRTTHLQAWTVGCASQVSRIRNFEAHLTVAEPRTRKPKTRTPLQNASARICTLRTAISCVISVHSP